MLAKKKVFCSLAVLLCTGASAVNYTFRPDYGLEMAWNTDDRVGITTGNVTYGEMEQLSFWISSKATATPQERNLYSVGYQLKTTTQYFSYSPYKWAEVFDAHNIQCRYERQEQKGNGSTSDLASLDFQMAAATTTSTACTFQYQHIGGVLRFSFPAPAAMTISEFRVTTETPTLATTAVMDIIDQKVTPDDFSTAMILQTKDLNVTRGEEVVLYMACPPQDLSSTVLHISVADGNGNSVPLASFAGPNVKAGRLYDIAFGGASRAAARTLQNVNSADLQNVQEPVLQRIAGISNPLAHAEDFLIDKEYVCAVKAPVTDKRTLTDNYYTLDGMRTASPRTGNIYIHKGKKIVRQN